MQPQKICHTGAVISGGGWGNSGNYLKPMPFSKMDQDLSKMLYRAFEDWSMKKYSELRIDSRKNSILTWLQNMSVYSVGHNFTVAQKE